MAAKKTSREKGNLRLNGINSSDILDLLGEKHSKDVFIPECKNGETWGARDLLKLDAWVLCRTYSPLNIIGYEIKCSRRDFEQDQKWTGYMDLCHQFYFVCPAGLIRATDLPAQVGIIWATGKRLHTKRRAVRVDPDPQKLLNLLIYVVMSRSKIVENMFETAKPEPKSQLEIWREEVEQAKARKELALFIGGHVREVYEEVRRINSTLKNREDIIDRFVEKLAKLGIKWDPETQDWMHSYEIENQIDLLFKRLDWRTVRKLEAVRDSVDNLLEDLKGLKQAGN